MIVKMIGRAKEHNGAERRRERERETRARGGGRPYTACTVRQHTEHAAHRTRSTCKAERWRAEGRTHHYDASL